MAPYRELSRSIAGGTALVTGAASGIGRATAHLFAREGAIVAVTDVDEAGCAAVVAEIEAAGYSSAKAFALDVSCAENISMAVDDIANDFGGLDILINNAGVSAFSSLDSGAEYDAVWDRALSVMLTGQQRVVRACLPWLRDSESPRIVNIASTEGLGATAGDTPYIAAKTGIIGLTRGLAVDLGQDGITVNCICPGPIRTNMTQAVPEDQKTIFANRRTTLRRYGFAEEVAQMILSCVLPAASFLTGAIIPVDGGLMVRNA
jgi:3-oxoacyl-[acyl-carrier protein] reductase